MVKKKQNLSSSPSTKNASVIRRSIVFIVNIFKYFYYGVEAIISFIISILTLSFLRKSKKGNNKKIEKVNDKYIFYDKALKRDAKRLKKEHERLNKKAKNIKNEKVEDIYISYDKTLKRDAKRLKIEQKRLNKKEKQEKKEKARLKKQAKLQELSIRKQKRLQLQEKKISEKIKKQEAKIIARAEKQKAKEKKLIERIEQEDRLRREKQEALKRRKENVAKIKQAKLEALEKKKSAEKLSFEERIKAWYKNLSFVKYRENKAEMERQVLLINFEGEDAVRSEQKIYYKYVAKKIETSEVEKGTFPAFSKLDVHSFLLAEGYEVYEITPQKNYSIGVLSRLTKKKMKKSDLIFFLTQLSTFLKSGLPLLDSIKILEKQTKDKAQKNLYKSISYELTMGENFSESLEKQGESFPKLLVNMIRSAELAGNLPEILDDMAVYYDEMEKTRKQMKSAMTYPAVIFVFATVVIIFIMIFVIPEFVGIYADMDTELPSITKTVIGLSEFLQQNIIYLILGIIALIFIIKSMYKSIKLFRTMIQWMMMHLPVFGNIMIYNEVTMFTKTFGSLLNHNVFITESMEVLSKITNNEIYKMLIFDTITNLAKGSPISSAFKNQWSFPIIAYEMLLTGERTGELGDMMVKVSNYYQMQHKNSVNQIKTFIEPIMIVFLTVMVGFILMSVLLPMFNMYSGVLG